MSHWRLIAVRLRALLAAALICALTSMQLAAAASGHGAPTARHSIAASMVSAHCAAVVPLAHPHAGSGEQTRHQNSGPFSCPYCCLAAAPAVLPERVGAPLRVMRIAATRAPYFALIAREPESCVLPAVNGARAPPRAPLA
jgi:hypothetical protein